MSELSELEDAVFDAMPDAPACARQAGLCLYELDPLPLVWKCVRCGRAKTDEAMPRMVTLTAISPESTGSDPYDDFCPTCDAPNPTHTPTCAVVHTSSDSEDDARRIADGRALGFIQPDDPELTNG